MTMWLVQKIKRKGKKRKDKNTSDENRMRFQVQWNTSGNGPTFSEVAKAPSIPGVTTAQAIIALNQTINKVVPSKAKYAAEVAAVQQRIWIRQRPPRGISTEGYSKSEYFQYKNYTDARVDVENLKGHNLKQ